jgi:GT2 family glycosyltransferase
MKISFVIPAYNEEKGIERCVKSVLMQNYKNLEIIVVDDCSKDRTSEVAKKLNVKVVRNKKNLGIAESMNRGAKASKGDFIVTLHADAELVGRNWIKGMLEIFENDKSVGVVTCNRIPEFKKKLSPIEKVHLYFGGGYSISKLKKPTEIYWLPTRCDMFKRKALEDVNFFDKKFRVSGEDIDISTKLRKKGYKLIFNPNCSAKIHLSSFQGTFYRILKKRVYFGKVIPSLLIRHSISLVTNKTWFITTVPYMIYFLLIILSFFNPLYLFLLFFLNLLISIRIAKVTGLSSFPVAFVLIPIYTAVWGVGIIYGLFLINKKII